MTQALNIAFLIDPLVGLQLGHDSSIAMMQQCQQRGHHIHIIEKGKLCWQHPYVQGRAFEIHLTENQPHTEPWYTVISSEDWRPIKDFDALLIRQDPPFDIEYLVMTWLLEQACREGAKVFNHPLAVRNYSEKLSILQYPQYIPATLVSNRADQIKDFINTHHDVILKPLDGMGGTGIFRVTDSDPNQSVIIEMLSQLGQRTIMAQKYLPEIRQGDKRILLIGGEVAPYSLARFPKQGETRGNLAAGGKGIAMPLTEQEYTIATQLAPKLWQQGLLIVGLDMIGNHITEINVTSPTCMVEIEQQTQFNPATMVIEKLEQALENH